MISIIFVYGQRTCLSGGFMSTGNFQALFLCPFIKCGQGQGQGCPTVGNLQICLRDGGGPTVVD
jgi:hypothetical protein